MSLLLGWRAYARDKNTSARLCAKKVGRAYARGGGVFAGHYGIWVCAVYIQYSGKLLQKKSFANFIAIRESFPRENRIFHQLAKFYSLESLLLWEWEYVCSV